MHVKRVQHVTAFLPKRFVAAHGLPVAPGAEPSTATSLLREARRKARHNAAATQMLLLANR